MQDSAPYFSTLRAPSKSAQTERQAPFPQYPSSPPTRVRGGRGPSMPELQPQDESWRPQRFSSSRVSFTPVLDHGLSASRPERHDGACLPRFHLGPLPLAACFLLPLLGAPP
eukprot:8250018-Pyramimonas_sp.AAC.1